MKKLFALLNAALILAVLISDYCYINHGTLRIKATTSLLFTMIGAVNLAFAFAARAKKSYPAIMFAGLVFAMMGDIGLRYNFILGAALFALGHVLYFASFCALERFRVRDLIPAAAIFDASAILLLGYKGFRFGSKLMLNVCLVYALVISLMVGKSVSNFLRNRNIVFAIAMIGSVMFYISDLMLVLYKFADMPRIIDTMCLVFYYPGQCVLGLSAYMYVHRAVKQ